MLNETILTLNETILPLPVQEAIKSLTRSIAALGGIILLYLIYQTINLFMNKGKNKELKKINQNLEEIKKLLEKNKH